MAIIGNNPIMKGTSGRLGDTFYIREWRGRLVMCKMPKRRKRLSPKQKVTVSQFKLAAKYAAVQMKDEIAKAEYQERTNFRRHSAYLVALNDYLNPPTVNEIRVGDYHGAIGDTISVDASDDFKVVRVIVVIRNSDGAILEEGNAKLTGHNPHLWTYEACVSNPHLAGTMIMAMAYDGPGNVAVAERVV